MNITISIIAENNLDFRTLCAPHVQIRGFLHALRSGRADSSGSARFTVRICKKNTHKLRFMSNKILIDNPHLKGHSL